ncbi:MAG: DeoR/GlpR family DNA-binding transcription regulator [Alphaproteobacteria bacterium]|nr:DeoR/GlpR family DNA-binding transcription regulator [Alphaproteobacteria bacterium]MBU0793447.1 DeoR/GlpR family DNA-binding transcription regulator [Alphaproteobacteria bacterium]MBU0876095.1 DeoR/GlpR family DNA-binding transcription regulator [Alphaproteobacteria bacterium]MBU1770703.1 DeoR/GlpR family DNA-binding transcription regulator [Alphaproteobacteria bacterium]
MTSASNTRHRQILDLARRNGKVTVEDLVSRLNVTPQTIRKDLNDLCERGYLSRVHGGAILGSGVENLQYEARRRLSVEEKAAIGREAAARIPDGASLFINIGTTTEEVARALAGRTNLLVLTNNLNVVDILCRNPAIDLIVVGGRVRHADRAAVGPTAVDFIRNFKVDFAVIGASAIDDDGSLLDFDLNEVQVSHAIVENSRSVILVADRSKLTRSAPVRIGHIGAIDVFVTDYLDSPELAAVCAEHNVEVVNALPELGQDVD